MSEYTKIKERWRDSAATEYTDLQIEYDIDELIGITKKQREAINELLANIELSHPEEYKQYRELPAVDEAYKLTEE